MKLAIKWDSIKIDEAGHVAGHSAGDTLVRRIPVSYTHLTLPTN